MIAPPESAPRRTPAPSLVGRAHELAALRVALDAALAGRGSLVLIGGEAGIGKTALAEALLGEATDRGALALVGHCYDRSETPPYGPWRELFGVAPRDPALPPLPTALLPANRGSTNGGPPTGQEAIFAHAGEYLTALAARRPLVLLVEDLHWADPTTLDMLRVLARNLVGLPLLLLATYRAEDVARDHALIGLLPALVREARAERLDLRPLDDAAIGALVAGHYPLAASDAGRLAGYLAGRTEGNALFLGELLRTLEGEGILRRAGDRWTLGNLAGVPVPPLLRQVIAGRVARLDPETARLLVVAAVVGQEVPLAVWAAVSEVGEAALLDHAERAIESRLLAETPDGTGVRFAHALIREALYEGTLALRRRALHRRAGEALLALPTPAGSPPEWVRYPSDPDAVAYHFQRASDPRAFDWLVRAAAKRSRARGWLLFCRSQLLMFSDNAQGQRALTDAASLAVAANDQLLAAYVGIFLGQLRCLGGHIRQGLAEIEQGVAALEALPDAYRLESVLDVGLATLASLLPDGEWTAAAPPAGLPAAAHRSALVNWFAHTGRYREALALGEAHLAALAAIPGDDQSWRGIATLHGLGHAYAALGHPSAARQAYARSRTGHGALGNAHMVAFTIWSELQLAVLPYQADDVAERARLATEAARAWERARGTITDTPHGDPTDLLLALVEGRWVEAHRLAVATLVAATAGHAHGAIVALGTLARHQGDPAADWAWVSKLHPAGPATEPGDCYFHHGIALQALAADLALDAGDPVLAQQWIAAHGRWLDWSGAELWRADYGRLRARLAWVSGDLLAARAHAERALAHATEPRQPLALLAAHRLLGELDTATGRHDEAQAHLDAALALADACAAPHQRALTLLALAAHRAGPPAGPPPGPRNRALAEVALNEAITIATALNAAPTLARAETLATTLRLIKRTFPAGLTAREVEVLRLLATGQSNREIAATLHLSFRTVERHIATIYNKTDAHGRAEATAYAFRHQLT